jgi:NADPH:quinone reductase-like Zn-dependent oxidoreductase
VEVKVAVYRKYGAPHVVQIEDVPKPVPKDNEVLVKVRAASVNPLDWKVMSGGPYIIRTLLGLGKPKIRRPGVDLAGQVDAVGGNATQLKPGDEVFGTCRGAFAEYVCCSESGSVMKSVLVAKPENVTFEQAASAPIAALTALQGLRDKGRIQPGQRVLINGAGGGVGTFAVQIAKSFGAEVTGVCSTRNVHMVRSIGADHVIDYTREDFTKTGQSYDVLFDCVGNHPLLACRRALAPMGRLIMVGAPDTARLIGLLARLIGALVLSPFVGQKFVPFLAKSNKEDLTTIGELMAIGKVTPVIDKRYRLSEVPEALWYLKEGYARGKVVISVEHRNQT